MDLTDSPQIQGDCKSIHSLKMAGKHSLDKAGFTTELEREDEDTLLCDDDMNNSLPRTIPVASATANDSLELTLLKLTDMSVSQSVSSMRRWPETHEKTKS